MSLVVGVPAPWPARVSMRISVGLLAGLGGLQRGGELEAVGRHHAVVVVAGGDQRRRILRAGLQVVQRRVGQQRFELLGVVGRAVFVDPGPADRELVEAEHVHHADRRARPRANSSGRCVMAAPTSRPPLLPPRIASFSRRRVLVGDQPLGRGDESRRTRSAC